MHHLANEDALEWLVGFGDRSADLIITDPPYESMEKHRKVGTTTRLTHSKSSSNDWFEVFPNALLGELFRQCYRVLDNNRHFYMFSDQETMFIAKPLAEAAGFKFWKPLIWDKQSIGMGYHYRARYECILFFEKGKRKLADLGIADVLPYPRINNGYPTEKPVELARTLISQSARAGERVYDPFMGSGNFGAAAISLGCHFFGNDLSPTAMKLATERCEGAAALHPHGPT